MFFFRDKIKAMKDPKEIVEAVDLIEDQSGLNQERYYEIDELPISRRLKNILRYNQDRGYYSSEFEEDYAEDDHYFDYPK